MNNFPRISFGMIVLNGEPFLRYNLRSIYPFAHQIIIVEGAVPAAAGIALPNGHSIDSTLETLRDFMLHEDPEDKLFVITAEDDGHPNGFWPGEKLEQSQAYARRATGDYLWQIDVDEFYKPGDIQKIIGTLQANPEISTVSFKQITFWGGIDYITDGWYLRRGAEIYHRLFKWGPGYHYLSHRPPTVHDESDRDLRSLQWVRGDELVKRGIFLYHYSLLFPKQVIEKCKYYANADWVHRTGAEEWAENSYLKLERPFRVHNVYDYISWLEYYKGDHPPQIMAMWQDIADGRIEISLRPNDDLEQLLHSTNYSWRREILKRLSPVARVFEDVCWWLTLPIRIVRKRLGFFQ